LQENLIMKPFQHESGELDTITIIFWDLNPASREAFMAIADADMETLADGLYAPVSWEYVDRKWEDQRDGTAKSMVVCKLALWDNTVTAGTPARSTQMAMEGADSEVGLGKKRTDAYNGVNIDDVESVIQTLDDHADDGDYVVDYIQELEADNGEAKVTRKRTYRNKAITRGDALVTSIATAVGKQQAACVWMWPNVSQADADTLIATIAIADVAPYSHARHWRSSHPNGLVTVTQLGIVPRGGGGAGIVPCEYKAWKQRYETCSGNVSYRVVVGLYIGTNEVRSVAIANAGTPAASMPYKGTATAGQGSQVASKRDWERIVGTDYYRAMPELWKAGEPNVEVAASAGTDWIGWPA